MATDNQPITFIDRRSGDLVTESPPGEGLLTFFYHHPLGKLGLHALVKRKLVTQLYGSWMDSAASRRQIVPFVEEYGIDMSEARRGVEEFSSFNDFFYRKLRPEVRPIGTGFVSPADGKLLAFERVGEVEQFYVKGEAFSLEQYLRDAQLAREYQDASMLIVRLAPNDYHRYHFPCAGVAAAPRRVPGYFYSVSPHAVRQNFARVFCENKREFTWLDSPDYGRVLISPVGATMVGKIISTYAPDSPVAKGDEMGYFAFGGSSLLLLIPRDRIRLDADLLENTRNGYETAVQMGERVGE